MSEAIAHSMLYLDSFSLQDKKKKSSINLDRKLYLFDFFYETSDVFLPLATVGSALHDPDRLCQKQPDRFLLGLSGSRCECSSSLPPALVSTSLSTEIILGSFCGCGFSFVLLSFCLDV